MQNKIWVFLLNMRRNFPQRGTTLFIYKEYETTRKLKIRMRKKMLHFLLPYFCLSSGKIELPMLSICEHNAKHYLNFKKEAKSTSRDISWQIGRQSVRELYVSMFVALGMKNVSFGIIHYTQNEWEIRKIKINKSTQGYNHDLSSFLNNFLLILYYCNVRPALPLLKYISEYILLPVI